MGERILVIDDEAPLLRLLQAHLKELSYEVIVAADGVEGLRLLRDAGADMVLCDFVMPDMDGGEFLVQAKKEFPHLPVVIMTGYPSRDNLRACLAAGAEDYLTKPFSQDSLKDVVRRCLLKAKRLAFLCGEEEEREGTTDEEDTPRENPLEGSW